MGNSLLRQNRWQQTTQETPWNLGNQNRKQRTSRKRIDIFKARQDSQKENKGTASTPIQQDDVDHNSSEELCYTLINHSVLRRRPSEKSAEGWYENISREAETPREASGGTETEYSLVHVPPTPRHPPSAEDEYELLMPRVSSHSLHQPRPLRLPPENQFVHL
uniref:Germinal center associated signaling and motility n=1 Tax=Equus caballus TaxID=9796 RepID=A0A5F5PUY8_HORSE|nr:PREDICTED: germinal center-associated signaling and motility protein isoform X3 [Equus przewalskii]